MAKVNRSPDVDEYIATLGPAVQPVMEKIRTTLHKAVPGSGEMKSYRIAALTLDGKVVVYFAGYAKHVSMYPVPDVKGDLADEMQPYRSGASTLKFPLKQEIPYDLMARVAQAHATRVRKG